MWRRKEIVFLFAINYDVICALIPTILNLMNILVPWASDSPKEEIERVSISLLAECSTQGNILDDWISNSILSMVT